MQFFPCFSLLSFKEENKVENPMLLHHSSITAPSIVHRNDGVSMD